MQGSGSAIHEHFDGQLMKQLAGSALILTDYLNMSVDQIRIQILR